MTKREVILEMKSDLQKQKLGTMCRRTKSLQNKTNKRVRVKER